MTHLIYTCKYVYLYVCFGVCELTGGEARGGVVTAGEKSGEEIERG